METEDMPKIEFDAEMQRQVYEGWMRGLADAGLVSDSSETVTLVGNNRVWNQEYKANHEVTARVPWSKEGF